ncbi:MAG: RusA family crossover junction endodeoxyribonuclease [Pseudomonadota bacterium]
MIQFTIPGNAIPKGRPRTRIMPVKGGADAMRAFELEVKAGKWNPYSVFNKMRDMAKQFQGFVSIYTPKETVEYEAKVSAIARAAMRGKPPSAAPIEIMLELRMPIPVSWSKAKRAAAAAGLVRHTKKPDAGNIQKAIEDAMNEIVYVDDSQIVVTTVRKLYHEEPCAIVAVRVVDGESA